jgi:hypothetical protein
MKRFMRLFLVSAVALSGIFAVAGAASAQGNNANQNDTCRRNAAGNGGACNSTQEGDNDGSVDQSGTSSSGDGVAGQVAGVVSAGDASVDATNRSDDVSVTTGDAEGTNTGTLDVGSGINIGSNAGGGSGNNANLNSVCRRNSAGNGSHCINRQIGDNDGSLDQAADAASGDGVGGQVIGVVTSAGGSADLVLDNESTDSDVTSGDGTFDNNSDAFVGRGVRIGSVA